MALRVLLADESSTIKKVVQLTLQDFDVDVRSVSVGLDVLSVAKTFRPDMVLADVLLAKRSGYEVCHDLKSDPETSQIPVVLMWSGFMEIDEQKARLSGAEKRIEKPFDPATLRQIVQDLVKKTQANPVSSFIHFPPLPEFQETRPAPVASPAHEIPALVVDDGEAQDEWIQQPAPVAPTPAPRQPAAEEFEEFELAAPQKVAEALASQIAKGAGSQFGDQEEWAREEIQKWLTLHMPAIAERIIREEINRLLQDSEQSIET